MRASNLGLKWEDDLSTDKMSFQDGRNQIAQMAYSGNLDGSKAGIVWIDSDIVPLPDSIVLLLLSAQFYDAEFVSGVYHQKGGDCKPIFYVYEKETDLFKMAEKYSPNLFAKADGCGFGFCWTSMKTIRAIAGSKAFNTNEGWFPDKRGIGSHSEDLNFCLQAMAAGIQLYVNTSLQLGHSGDPKIYGREDFLKPKIVRVI